MRKPGSMTALEDLGRVRLSRHFYMREFLYSEIGNFYGIPNIPDDPDLAIAAGTRLCTDLLDPLFETFGNVAVRSSFRSFDLNGYGNEHQLGCAGNEVNFAKHIWDRRDADGHMGATACIFVPWFADQSEKGRDWRDLAWWIHDHLPYSKMVFFPKYAAFNLTWCETPERAIYSQVEPKGAMLKAGEDPAEPLAARQDRYADFPPFRAITLPEPPK